MTKTELSVVLFVVIAVFLSITLLPSSCSRPSRGDVVEMISQSNLRSVSQIVAVMASQYDGRVPRPSELAIDAGMARDEALLLDTSFGFAGVLAYHSDPDHPRHMQHFFLDPRESDPRILDVTWTRREDGLPWFDIAHRDGEASCDVLGPMSYASTPLFGERASAWGVDRQPWMPQFGYRARRTDADDPWSIEVGAEWRGRRGPTETVVVFADGSIRKISFADYTKARRGPIPSNGGAPDHLYVNEADGTAEASDDLDQGNAFLAVVKSVTGSREVVGVDGEVVVEPMISVGDLFWE